MVSEIQTTVYERWHERFCRLHRAGRIDWRMYEYYVHALAAATYDLGPVLPMWQTLRRWYRAEQRQAPGRRLLR